MKYLSFIVYIPLQILAIPLAIVGLLLTAYKQIIVSKRLGVSQTAIEIINGRWTMHVFGLRLRSSDLRRLDLMLDGLLPRRRGGL